MAILKKATVLTLAASAGVMSGAGFASAHENESHLSPDLGCLANHTASDLTAQGVVGLIPVGVALTHLLEHSNLNVVASGNTMANSVDNGCNANPDS